MINPYGLLNSSLIFFAAEDEGRTEQPTERRVQKEREKGRVPKSQEIPAILIPIAGFILLFFISTWFMESLFNLNKKYLGNFNLLPDINIENFSSIFLTISKEIAILISPIFILVFLVAIIGNVIQSGFLFSLKPLALDWSKIKLTPATILKKVFASKQIIFNLVKTLLKILFLLVVSYVIITYDFIHIMKVPQIGLPEALRNLAFIAFKLSLILLIILLAFSVPDYFFQKHEFIESLKMTKQEIKQEIKESEGDPLVKQRQKQRSMEMLRKNMLGQVKKSDIVITNPTHYAIALRYDPQLENSPRVMFKGEDHLAFLIRNLAKKNGIPILENKMLARELYATVEEGELVPEQFYRVLVDIFINIEKIRERLIA